jgi:hypothetical protein
METELPIAPDKGERLSHSDNFIPEERAWNPLYRRLSGPQSQSAYGGNEKNHCSCQESRPYFLVIQPVP